MKIYRIFAFMALVAPTLLFTSCLKDDDEVFDDSSSQRLQQALDETKAILRSPEYGWVMDYYYGDDQANGGLAFTIKFDSLTCTAASESTPQESTSYYKMTTDNGPVVTFDTYNPVLHEFSTPSFSDYEGLGGDFEYLVLSATEDLVVLKGKRWENYITMRPLEEPALDYLAKVDAMREEMSFSTASVDIDGTTLSSTYNLINNHVTYSYGDLTETRAFVITDKGLRLYSDVSLGGVSFSEFTFEPTSLQLTCTNPGTSLVMQGHRPSDYLPYEAFEGTYNIYYSMPDDNGRPSTDELSVTVHLTPAGDGATYYMTGLSENFEHVVLQYNKQTGRLQWYSQQVGESDGNQVWLCAASWTGGLYPGLTIFGLETVWNEDEEHPVFDLVNIDNEVFLICDSFVFWELDASLSSIGQFRDWGINGYIVMTYLTRMAKL